MKQLKKYLIGAKKEVDKIEQSISNNKNQSEIQNFSSKSLDFLDSAINRVNILNKLHRANGRLNVEYCCGFCDGEK